MSAAASFLFWLPIVTAIEPTPWIETPLPPNVAVEISEIDLAAKLGTLGPAPDVVLVTANKGQANALYNVIGAQAGYRFVQAGSASEALRPVQAMGAKCGAFLSRSSSGIWKATAVGTCPGIAATAPTPVAAAVPASSAPTSVSASSPPAAPRPADALLAQVLAAPDATARKKILTDALGSGQLDGETAGIAGQALAVAGYLDSTHRTDPSIVRMFMTAAFSTDPATRGAAVDAARAGGDPPTPAATTSVVPFATASAAVPHAAADPSVLRKYNTQRLVRGPLDMTVGSTYGVHGNTYGSVSTIATWTVRDGAGAPLNTFGFAALVGDTAKTVQLKEKRTTAQVLAIGGLGIGTGLLFGAVGAAANPQSNAWLGLTVAGTVLYIPGIVGVYQWSGLKMISKHYTPPEADRWIEKYNAALRTQLGLTEQDVQSIDTK